MLIWLLCCLGGIKVCIEYRQVQFLCNFLNISFQSQTTDTFDWAIPLPFLWIFLSQLQAALIKQILYLFVNIYLYTAGTSDPAKAKVSYSGNDTFIHKSISSLTKKKLESRKDLQTLCLCVATSCVSLVSSCREVPCHPCHTCHT